MDTDYCVVFITTDGAEQGQQLADALVAKRVAACVNVLPQVKSLFWWQGKVDRADEAMLVVKTKRSLLEGLKQVVEQIHSYDVPEIIALPIIWGSESYLEWLNKEASADPSS